MRLAAFSFNKSGQPPVMLALPRIEPKDTREPQVYSPFILYCTAVPPVSIPHI
jgi:hypothetical protein